MSAATLTLSLPDPLYEQLRARAQRANRSVEAELLDVVASAVHSDDLPDELTQAVASLALLDDAALWRMARGRFAADAAERIGELHLKKQCNGLTDTEIRELTSLMAQYERAMLIRASAIALLHERGHDVSEFPAP